MNRQDLVKWIRTEFSPLTLATPPETIFQIIDNAVLYLNSFSSFRAVVAVSIAGNGAFQMPNTIKTVVTLYPAMPPMSILTNYPMWSLLGIAVLDNATSDLIMMTEAFKAYKYYLGSDLRWTFEPSPDPSVGGKLYVTNFPINCMGATAICTKYFQCDDTNAITETVALAWLRQYIKALVKKAEGNLLRKSDLIGVHNDGQELYNEGAAEQEKLENKLNEYGRWVAFIRRI